MASGIYKIENTITGKCYVGSSVNVKKRWATHLLGLCNGKHQNSKMQNSWSKHGKEAFKFTVLEFVENVADLLVREQHYIVLLNCFEDGYNLSPIAGSALGTKRSQEVKRKMSLAKLGKKNSKEHCTNISLSKLGNSYGQGRIVSEEHKQKLSQLMKGNKHSQGVVFSKERKQKIANALKGNTNAVGACGMLGKTHSRDTRTKMAIAQEARRARESRLSEEQAKAILSYPRHYGFIAELVRQYGVSRDIITGVLTNKTFKHLER
jgi:group I intron endonuclease